MKNKQNKTVYFPHVIPGNVLDGEVKTFNSINKGMKSLSDFGIDRNKFLGGNSAKMIGLMKEYGFYAIPHFESNKIVGFYIHDPDTLTERGRKVLEDLYPDYTIEYDKRQKDIHTPITQDVKKKTAELLEKAKERGIKTNLIGNATVEELDGLIQAFDSGKGLKAVQEPVEREVIEEINIKHKATPVRTKGK